MSGDHNMHQADQCNHLWRYIGSKRQAAWVCSHCQALRVSEPPAREWVGLTHEEFKQATEGLEDLEDCWMAIEAKLKEKNTHAKPNQDLCGND